MANSNLSNAKNVKNDEFYTQYHDIEKEITAYIEYNPDVFKGKTIFLPCDDPEWSNFTKYFAQNFERLGLKKLISTSFAPESKNRQSNYQPTIFESGHPQFDEKKTIKNGKIFTLSNDMTGDGKIDVDDLDWQYLKGSGDFRSDEIKKIRDASDVIITNPPFSLFRNFLAWILESEKPFVIIGSMNAITYKEVFPLIKNNKVWLGATGNNSDMVFAVPEDAVVSEKDKLKAERLGYVGNYTRLGNSCWFTTLDHGKRHQSLPLMTELDVIKFGTQKAFEKYDNYDAIEIPYVKYIPSDYNGVMGVPISFLDKYSPEQFKIVGFTSGRDEFECTPSKRYKNAKQHNPNGTIVNGSKANTRATLRNKEKPSGIYYTADNAEGTFSIVYARILIKHI